MNDYMQALHQRFCREPTHPELERALDDTYHALRGNIAWQDQELLLRAQDLEIEPYCFEDEEEKRATERAKMRCPQSKN